VSYYNNNNDKIIIPGCRDILFFYLNT